MVIGILSGILATSLWGFVFVAPLLVPSVDSLSLVICRMAWFGVISLAIAWLRGYKLKQIPKAHWKLAFVFALTGYTLYYLILVLGIRLSSPSVASLLDTGGIIIAVAVCGMVQAKQQLSPKLYLSIVVSLIGVVIINLEEIRLNQQHGWNFVIGLGLIVICVAMWTWYAQRNAKFLKENPTILSTLWGTIVGVATLGSLLLFLPLFLIESYTHNLFQLSSQEWTWLLFVGFVLGFGSSWLAGVLWNQASQRLPLTLVGQLVIFATILGLTYVFLHRQEWPTFNFILGSCFGIGGILWSLRLIHKPKQREKKSKPVPVLTGE